MKQMTRKVLLGVSGSVIFLSSFGLQSAENIPANEQQAMAEKIQKLEQELALVQKEKDAVTKELESAKQRIDATNTVIIGSHEKLLETRKKAMTEAALYEKMLSNLSSEVKTKQITIQQMRSGVILNLPSAILFESGSADIKKSGAKVLNKVAKELLDVPYQTIVAGFTDNVPVSKNLKQFASNWDLAAARATSVVHIMEKSGVPKGRLVVVSLGDNQPVASNDTAEGRAKNRRIEIRLRPLVVNE